MTMKHIFYAGNGTTPVDSGLPHVGRFYTVDDDDVGLLRFFHYTGNGEPDPSGALGFTEDGNNSSNPIGNGFQSMLHLLGGGDGIILAIPLSGDLTFFRYTGNGERDETGTQGFDGPHQATVIGNGFQTLPPRLRVAPGGTRDAYDPVRGEPGRRPALVPVQRRRRARPLGDAGLRGSEPGQPDRPRLHRHAPPRGLWAGARSWRFPENGDLLWFQLHRQGRAGPHGAPWASRSPATTPATRSAAASPASATSSGARPTGVDGLACCYGVTNDGDLLFWRYSGDGEQDPTGALGFDGPHQATQIGNGF